MDDFLLPMDLVPGGNWEVAWAYPADDDQERVVVGSAPVVAFAGIPGSPTLEAMVSIAGRMPTAFANTRLGQSQNVASCLAPMRAGGFPDEARTAAMLYRRAEMIQPPWPKEVMEDLALAAGDALLLR